MTLKSHLHSGLLRCLVFFSDSTNNPYGDPFGRPAGGQTHQWTATRQSLVWGTDQPPSEIVTQWVPNAVDQHAHPDCVPTVHTLYSTRAVRPVFKCFGERLSVSNDTEKETNPGRPWD
jgi:hypothetical protein